MERQDYFSIHELYYLISAFDGTLIMGLPALEELPLPSDSIWEDTHQALQDKGFVDETGHMTEPGFVLVETLRDYCTGHALTVINNVYLMHTGEDRETVVLVQSKEGYQLLRVGPFARLAFFQEKLPELFLREPSEGDDSFLTTPLELTEEIESALAQPDTLVVQHFPLAQMKLSKHREALVVSWLFRVENQQLLGYDVTSKTLQLFSQYYFLERLYSWLAIPFREEEIQQWLKS